MRLVRKLIPVLALVLVPGLSWAESQWNTAGGAAAARMNLRVVIPFQLYFAVGPGATGPRVPNATVTTITYNALGAGGILGNGTPSTAASIPVRIYCNGGPTSISVSHPVNMVSGTDVIPFTQILATSLSPTTFPVPVMGGGPVNPTLSSGTKITDRSGTWQFIYANTVKPAPGTYSGTATYTATVL
jgi:hypothetical protein